MNSMKNIVTGAVAGTVLTGCVGAKDMGDGFDSVEDFRRANEVCQVETTTGDYAEIVQGYILDENGDEIGGGNMLGFKGECGYGYNEEDGKVIFTNNAEEVARIEKLLREVGE